MLINDDRRLRVFKRILEHLDILNKCVQNSKKTQVESQNFENFENFKITFSKIESHLSI